MKISWKSKLKRMGIQTLAVFLGASILWGAGRVNPVLFEKTHDTLSTSTDVKWVMKKTDEMKTWIKSLGERGVD